METPTSAPTPAPGFRLKLLLLLLLLLLVLAIPLDTIVFLCERYSYNVFQQTFQWCKPLPMIAFQLLNSLIDAQLADKVLDVAVPMVSKVSVRPSPTK